MSNSGGPLQLLRNDGEHGHWVGIQLVGRKSNRQGIGARLVAETPSRKEAHALRPGRKSATCPPRTRASLFGLGAETSVKKLTIYWPSGTVQVLENLPAGKYLKIEEK